MSARSRGLTIACAWIVCVLAPDLGERGRDLVARGKLAIVAYALACALAVFAWLVGLEWLRTLRARLPWLGGALLALVAVFAPLAVVATVGYHAVLRLDLPASAFAFVLRNPRYGLTLMSEGSSPAESVALLAGPLVMAAALARATAPAAAPLFGARKAPHAVAAGALVLAILVGWRRAAPLPADLHGLSVLAVGTLTNLTKHPRLEKPERAAVAFAPMPTKRPDVVFFVQESLGAWQWAPWNPASENSPEIDELLRAHADHAFWYPKGTPVAGATDVSVPSMLTGLGSDAAGPDYTRAPLVWQEARALGYATALVSAQDFEEAHFSTYFLGAEAPEIAKVAADFPGLPKPIDGGIDDAVAIDAAIRVVDETPRERPLFLVVQLNGTHGPCIVPGASGGKFVGEGMSVAARCKIAARYVSRETARFFAHFDRVRGLGEAVVLHASDHGETFREDRPTRVESFYEDVFTIPLFVSLPRAMLAADPAKGEALRANRAGRVGHVDLYPTLLDVWGRWPIAEGALRPRLPGSSLLRPIPRDRVMVSTSTNDIRGWSREGFALWHGEWKWLVDDHHGVQAFDLAADPGETRDLARSAPKLELDVLRDEVARRPVIERILSRIGPSYLDAKNALR